MRRTSSWPSKGRSATSRQTVVNFKPDQSPTSKQCWYQRQPVSERQAPEAKSRSPVGMMPVGGQIEQVVQPISAECASAKRKKGRHHCFPQRHLEEPMRTISLTLKKPHRKKNRHKGFCFIRASRDSSNRSVLRTVPSRSATKAGAPIFGFNSRAGAASKMAFVATSHLDRLILQAEVHFDDRARMSRLFLAALRDLRDLPQVFGESSHWPEVIARFVDSSPARTMNRFGADPM